MKDFHRKKRLILDKVLSILFPIFSSASLLLLGLLLVHLFQTGLKWINWDFLINFPSRKPELSGLLPALVGSGYIVGLALLFSVPIGVGSALYLQEFQKSSAWTRSLNTLIRNMAGIPSIVYGIFGLTLFVVTFGFGSSLLAGSLTLSLLVLPIVIVATQEALKTVPKTIKEASYAVGATKIQTTWFITLRYALPNILTGIIFAVSRVLGETAPLMMVGGFNYVSFLPSSPFDSFSTLPIQIFTWTSKPQVGFQEIAAAAILVLLALQLLLNLTAIIVRGRLQKRYEE